MNTLLWASLLLSSSVSGTDDAAPLPSGPAPVFLPADPPPPAAVPDLAVCAPEKAAPAAAAAPSRAGSAKALAPFAAAARSQRLTVGTASLVVAAGMLTTGITYLVASQADAQLDPDSAFDTRTGGLVTMGASIVPAAIGVSRLWSVSDTELRDAQLQGGAAVEPMRASLAEDAGSLHTDALLTGLGLIGVGVVSTGVGVYFLALPHIPPYRGPISHATGAEMLGLAVGLFGVGGLTIALAGDDEPAQLAALSHE